MPLLTREAQGLADTRMNPRSSRVRLATVIPPLISEFRGGKRLRGRRQLLPRSDAAKTHVRSFVVVRPQPAGGGVLDYLNRSNSVCDNQLLRTVRLKRST